MNKDLENNMAYRTLCHMQPEHAKKALLQPEWWLEGSFVDPNSGLG